MPTPDIAVLYADHHGWLRRWLGNRLGDAHLAADLAHDTRAVGSARRGSVTITAMKTGPNRLARSI